MHLFKIIFRVVCGNYSVGVGNFFNWIRRQIIKTNTYVSEKPKLSKENLLHIFQQLSVKYPTINLNDNAIRDLILLFR